MSNTFEVVAQEWLEKQISIYTPHHRQTILRRLEVNAFPVLGKRPINRGVVDMAHRVLGDCGHIFRYAIATGRAERDVAADLRGALRPTVRKNFVSVTDPKKIGKLLCALEKYDSEVIVDYVLRLVPYLFVRLGQLVSGMVGVRL